MANSSLKIIDLVTRWPGSTHDSTIFTNSRLGASFDEGEYRDEILLGDSAYALKKSYLLTPILHPQTPAERLYNRSHIRTRNVVERLFGV